MKKSKIIALVILSCFIGFPCEAVYGHENHKYISVHNHRYIPRPDKLGFQELMIVPSYQHVTKRDVGVVIQEAITARKNIERQSPDFFKEQAAIIEEQKPGNCQNKCNTLE